MSVTMDRRRVARHEAGHSAASLMSGRVPAEVRIDWPEERLFGYMRRDLTTDGVNPESAPDLIVMLLCGPLAEGKAGWPIEWPLHKDAADEDARQCAVLADYLGLDEAGWLALVKQANELSKSPAFKHLLGLIASALEKVDTLSGEEIRFLVGPEVCKRYDIQPKETVPCSA